MKLMLAKFMRHKYLFLLTCGFIAALFIVIPNSYFNPEKADDYFMPSRQSTLNSYMDYLGSNRIIMFSEVQDGEVVLFFYLAYFGKLLGITDAWKVFLITQIIAAFVLLFVFPLPIYKITKSFLLACISPVLVYQCAGLFLIKDKNDINWIFIWLLIISIPLLYIYYKDKLWSKGFLIAFTALCLVMGIANIFRSHSALPVIMILIITTYYKLVAEKENKGIKNFLLCTCFMGIALIFYCLFSNIVPVIYSLLTNQPLAYSFGPWHSIYIGLGWQSNPFGIVFKDECAFAAVSAIDPDIIDNSEEYINTLKILYFDLFKSNPGYFFLTYSKKLVTALIYDVFYVVRVQDGVVFLFYIALFFVLLKYVFNLKNLFREVIKKYAFLLIISIVLIFGMMLYPMMALPMPPYLLGSITACDMLLFFIMIGLLEKFIHLVGEYYVSYKNMQESSRSPGLKSKEDL